MASREEVKAYKKFCEMAITERMSPAEVIQLATRGLLIADALTAAEEDRDRLREGHRLIKGFATHIMDNPVNPNLVWTRANNIVRWIEINAALHNTETEGSNE